MRSYGNLCKNNDHYGQGLCVGRVDQKARKGPARGGCWLLLYQDSHKKVNIKGDKDKKVSLREDGMCVLLVPLLRNKNMTEMNSYIQNRSWH